MRTRALVVVLAGTALVALAILVLVHRTDGIDGPAGRWTWSHRADTRPTLLRWLAWVSPSHMLLAVVALAVLAAAWRRTPWPAVVTVTTCALATIAELGLKWVMPRIELHLSGQGAAGFPSGHVVAAVAYTGALLLGLRRSARWWQWLPVLALGSAVSAAVVLTSLHTPSDVAGAWALSCGVLAAASLVGELSPRDPLGAPA